MEINKRIAILDADIFCYKVAEAAVREIPWNEYCVSITDVAEACIALDNWVNKVQDKVVADEVVMAFTGKRNFRKDIWHGYKAHRVKKPLMAFSKLKEYCSKRYPIICEEEFEADDILGIYVSNNFLYNHHPIEIVGVSEDKDMQAIPGMIFNPAKDNVIQHVSLKDAIYNFYLQVLTGDPADGYKGCIGIGETKARRALDRVIEECKDAIGFNFDKFINEGWTVIKKLYDKAGQGDEIIQASMAKILWYGEGPKTFNLQNLIDFKNKWRNNGQLEREDCLFYGKRFS